MFNKLSQLLLSRFKRKDDLSRQLEIVQIFDVFRTLVPENLSGMVEPLSLKNRILTLQITNHAVASELRFREPELIAGINEALGGAVIEQIRYRVS